MALFLLTLIQRAGYKLDVSAADIDHMMLATIHATSGVEDTLRKLFNEKVTP